MSTAVTTSGPTACTRTAPSHPSGTPPTPPRSSVAPSEAGMPLAATLNDWPSHVPPSPVRLAVASIGWPLGLTTRRRVVRRMPIVPGIGAAR
ncbi:MAG: hypothetical protein U0470_11530 [Anaerolineae bacterium]